jgi:hypothetical protein
VLERPLGERDVAGGANDPGAGGVAKIMEAEAVDAGAFFAAAQGLRSTVAVSG